MNLKLLITMVLTMLIAIFVVIAYPYMGITYGTDMSLIVSSLTGAVFFLAGFFIYWMWTR